MHGEHANVGSHVKTLSFLNGVPQPKLVCSRDLYPNPGFHFQITYHHYLEPIWKTQKLTILAPGLSVDLSLPMMPTAAMTAKAAVALCAAKNAHQVLRSASFKIDDHPAASALRALPPVHWRIEELRQLDRAPVQYPCQVGDDRATPETVLLAVALGEPHSIGAHAGASHR